MKQILLITFLPFILGVKASSGALVFLREPSLGKLRICQALAGGPRRPTRRLAAPRGPPRAASSSLTDPELPSLRLTQENKVTPSDAFPPTNKR